MRRRLGECLIHAGLISEPALEASLAEHRRTGERLGTILVHRQLVTDRQVAKALARQLGFPYVNLSENPPDPTVAAILPHELSIRHLCVAVRLRRPELTVAFADPLLFGLVRDIELLTGCRVKPVVSTGGDIREAIEAAHTGTVAPPARQLADHDDDSLKPLAGIEERSNAPAVVSLANEVVKGAIDAGARDVYVEPEEGRVRVRYGHDDSLTDAMELPAPMHEGLIARLKVMAGMDIAERRRPQIGRMSVTSGNALPVDFRASTRRTLHGETMVLRMLGSDTPERG